MTKCCPENEKIKHRFALYLEAADGKQSSTVDASLRAIARFEASTGYRPFKKFHIEHARQFRADLLEAIGPTGQPLSASTVTATLRRLREFFLWLSREPGYRSAINANDAAYFSPSGQDQRIASARRDRPVLEVDEIKQVVLLMPSTTAVERRDRALVAFALVSGMRDGALATLQLKHVDIEARTIFQDGREVSTKGRKTFTSVFFPVAPELVEAFVGYVWFLRSDLHFGPNDPLFPATRVGLGDDRRFEALGLSRDMWTDGAPIRRIFRDALRLTGLPYVNPHSFRKTLARLGERLCRTPEEWKAFSQNFGHESEATTFVGYGHVPTHRQGEIMRALAKPRPFSLPGSLDIAALETFLHSARGLANSTP